MSMKNREKLRGWELMSPARSEGGEVRWEQTP